MRGTRTANATLPMARAAMSRPTEASPQCWRRKTPKGAPTESAPKVATPFQEMTLAMCCARARDHGGDVLGADDESGENGAVAKPQVGVSGKDGERDADREIADEGKGNGWKDFEGGGERGIGGGYGDGGRGRVGHGVRDSIISGDGSKSGFQHRGHRGRTQKSRRGEFFHWLMPRRIDQATVPPLRLAKDASLRSG